MSAISEEELVQEIKTKCKGKKGSALKTCTRRILASEPRKKSR